MIAPLFRRSRSDDPPNPGDEALARLLQLLPAVRGFFMRRVPAGEVEDLTQEVVARMLGRRDGEAIENLEGYVFRVAANVLTERGRRNVSRRVAAHVELTDDHLCVEESSPERIVSEREVLGRMVVMIKDLPPRTQSAFVLHRFEDMTYEAIAGHMGISVSAVEKHIMRALRQLTEQVKTLEK